MRYKLLPANICMLLFFGLLVSCNVNGPEKTDTHAKTAIHSLLKNNDSLFSGTYSNQKLKNLLSHFPVTKNFPLIIDSAYMANVAVGHHSLGTKEVKMLVRLWNDDELLEEDSSNVCNFYLMDSLKTNHTVEKWVKKHPESFPVTVHAYGLQTIELKEETLLVWALVSSQQEADPIYSITAIYYTILNNNTILTTCKLGELSNSMDPPMRWENTLSSTLDKDGKLMMHKKSLGSDIDSDTAQSNHTHYQYLIHHGYTEFVMKKKAPPKSFKL
jgi:hypothetical protein